MNDNLYTYTPIFIDVTKKEVKAYDYSFKNGKGAKHKIPFEITIQLESKSFMKSVCSENVDYDMIFEMKEVEKL